MSEFLDGLVPIMGIIFSFGLPIVVVVMVFATVMHKKSRDKEIRQLLIENHTDPESIKLLLDEPKKQEHMNGLFAWGSILLGAGFGALINYLLGITDNDIYFWFVICFGMGLFMLIGYFLYSKIKPKQQAPEEP